MAGPARDTIEGVSLPPREAIAFLQQKTNTTTEHWTDVWRHAHSRSFMVAGAATEALVGDFRKEVAKALEQGTTLAEFRRGFDEIVGRTGWEYNGPRNWRTRIIFETNLSTAYSAGRYAQMIEPQTLAAFPYWRYVHSGAAHPRLQHKAWNGLTLRADDAFWRTHYPPNGWRCGCRVEPASARDLARTGRAGPDPAPSIETRPEKIGRTGRVEQVPVGIDPGFDYNPGLAWRGPPEIPGTADLRPPSDWPPPAPAVAREGRETRSAGSPPTAPVAPGGVSEADMEQLLRRAEQRVRRQDEARGGTKAAEFGAWFDDLAGRGLRPDGTRRVLGSLSETVLARLPDTYADPLQVTSASAAHLARDAKTEAGRGLPLGLLRRLPELLAAPRAVLLERKTGDVIVILREGGTDDGRVAKVVVRGGYTDKRRGEERVRFPGVVSAGLTPRQAFGREELYELLEGEM